MDSEAQDLDPSAIGRKRVTRRRFDPSWKQELIRQALVPGASVARLARDNDLNTNQLFKWCRLYERSVSPSTSTAALLPVTVKRAEIAVAEPMRLTIECNRGTIKLEGAIDTESLRMIVQTLSAR